MAKALPEKLITLLKEVNLTERQAVWDCHGTPVVLHKALEKVAAHHKIVFDQPKIIETDVDQKVEAAISFYQNCNKQRFLEFENRYNKLLNMIGLEEHQYQEIMETHDKRKEELKI